MTPPYDPDRSPEGEEHNRHMGWVWVIFFIAVYFKYGCYSVG